MASIADSLLFRLLSPLFPPFHLRLMFIVSFHASAKKTQHKLLVRFHLHAIRSHNAGTTMRGTRSEIVSLVYACVFGISANNAIPFERVRS